MFYNLTNAALEYGFMNEPLPSITMVASFFAAIISSFIFLTLHAIQKDIAEQLKCMEN